MSHASVQSPAILSNKMNDRGLLGLSRFSDITKLKGFDRADVVEYGITTAYHPGWAAFLAPQGGGRYIFKTAAQAASDGDVIDEIISHTVTGTPGYVAVLLVDGAVDFSQAGSKGDGVSDDYAAVVAALGASKKVTAHGNKTFVVTNGVTVPEGVELDLCGSTLKMTLVGTGGFDYGVRLSSYSWVVNGTIDVRSSGTVGSGSGIHCPINIGPLYGDGGTAASPSPFMFIEGWGINKLTLKTDRVGKVAVSVLGGVNNGYIGNVTIPDSATISGVHVDWSFVGTIDSYDIPTSRGNFDAGTAYTTHPNNIVIENIKAGSLTASHSHLLRLSGCHNVKASNLHGNKISGDGSSTAAIFHTAGDVGYEFAPADVKPFAHKGIEISNVTVEDCVTSWGMFVDCFADNVQAAVIGSGYVPLLPPYAKTDIKIKHVAVKSKSGIGASDGCRIQKIRGGEFDSIHPVGFEKGILVEEHSKLIKLKGCDPTDNRQNGIYVGHGTNKPRWIVVEDCHPYLNGTDAGAGTVDGIKFDGVKDSKLIRNNVGDEISETGQERGINVTSACSGMSVIDNHVNGTAGGVGILIGSSTDYGILAEFRNNTVDSGVAAPYSGANIIPFSRTMDSSGNLIRQCRGQRSALMSDRTPSAGDWQAGEEIFYEIADAGGRMGATCVVSGSPGTWKIFGTVDA